LDVLNYIGGELQESEAGAWLENVEPATGRPYGRVPDSTAADIDRAVSAAADAFPAWSHTPAAERSEVLMRMADAIEARLEEFARAESVDNGKPIAVSRAFDIPRAVQNFRFFAGAVLHTASQTHVMDHQALNYTLRRPRGVAGAISPWNLPIYLFSWKLAPALATGNTAVGKPSEMTPVTAMLLCEVAQEAGLPKGVLNVVHGRGPVAGARLVAHPGVATLSFTGSTRAGREIAGVVAPMFKKLALEMGGKNPNIVFADADLETALATTVRSSFANQGQICLCGSRVFVESSIFDDFVEGLVERTRALRIGDPLEEATQQGAVVSEAHRSKIESYVELARDEGGDVLCGGRRPDGLPDRCQDGFFYEPTIIVGLDAACRVNQEEIFGPVVTVLPFEHEDEVVSAANSVEYGLSATVWTESLTRAHRIADRLEAGTVWVNCWLLRDLRVPFGGMKASGVGREGGDEALRFFTEPKNVCVKL
jgi:aminomuconate-semialdehyde/2-hydroxymuconate-6-semialdehyde dehydrogenase